MNKKEFIEAFSKKCEKYGIKFVELQFANCYIVNKMQPNGCLKKCYFLANLFSNYQEFEKVLETYNKNILALYNDKKNDYFSVLKYRISERKLEKLEKKYNITRYSEEEKNEMIKNHMAYYKKLILVAEKKEYYQYIEKDWPQQADIYLKEIKKYESEINKDYQNLVKNFPEQTAACLKEM